MKKYWLIITLMGYAACTQAQQLGVVEEPRDQASDEDVALLRKNIRNGEVNDTTTIRLRVGLFGISARKCVEYARIFGDEGYLNIALTYCYRALDKKTKYDGEAREMVTRYGKKHIESLAAKSTNYYNSDNGRAGKGYADNLVRQIRWASQAPRNVRLALEASTVADLNKAAESWAERKMNTISEWMKKNRYLVSYEELLLVKAYCPAAGNGERYQGLMQRCLGDGPTRISITNFASTGGNCEMAGTQMEEGLLQHLSNFHPMLKVVSRSDNEQLVIEKKLADIDARELTGELQAQLQGSDYLVLGRVAECRENSSGTREVEVNAFKQRAYKVTVTNKEGKPEEQTRYAYDVPVKVYAVTASNEVYYNMSIKLYRINNGQLVVVRGFDDHRSSGVDYIYSPTANAGELSLVRVEPDSKAVRKPFEKQVSTKRLQPDSIEEMRARIVQNLRPRIVEYLYQQLLKDN